MERRLAAILAADVVGYSRLMGADEVGICTVQKPLGHSEVNTTMMYTRALNLGPSGVRSPNDGP